MSLATSNLAERFRVLALEARISAVQSTGADRLALSRTAEEWERRAAEIDAEAKAAIHAATALIANTDLVSSATPTTLLPAS